MDIDQENQQFYYLAESERKEHSGQQGAALAHVN